MATAIIQDRSLFTSVDDYGGSAEAEMAPGIDPDNVLRSLVDAGVGLSRFEIVEPSLQKIFIAKVGAEAATAVREVDDA